MRDNNRCRIEAQSLTDAIKKQNILAKKAIPSDVIKTGSPDGKKGCTYGLEFACAHRDNVRNALAESGGRGIKWIEE